VFDFFTPTPAVKHPVFSVTFLVVNVAVYAFMAGEYPW
jgi:hypothetical protein